LLTWLEGVARSHRVGAPGVQFVALLGGLTMFSMQL
jgi:hypothetical protein